MAWARGHIDRLLKGETVSFRPRGNSMTPKIHSGQLCTVEPLTDASIIEKGDIVLCKVNGAEYLHLVTSTKDDRFQISNNHGHVNGWVGRKSLFGRLIRVE